MGDLTKIYIVGAYITGFVTFIAVWIYAIISWGFLIGVAIGWLPAAITAFFAGLLWPIVAVIITIGIFYIYYLRTY